MQSSSTAICGTVCRAQRKAPLRRLREEGACWESGPAKDVESVIASCERKGSEKAARL